MLYYYILMLPALLFGLYAQAKLKSTFSRYSRVYARNGLTGFQAARHILDQNGLYDVAVEPIEGNLTDHYDPRTNVVRLSQSVYGSNSCAAIGVASHECGHAIQHATGYAPLNLRNAIVPITNIGSKLSVPLIIAGMFFRSDSLIMIGIVAYALIALFQLITLPVEYNASHRALAIIDSSNMLQGEEYDGAKATLMAAALTYVAALVSALSQLLYLMSLVSSGRRRN